MFAYFKKLKGNKYLKKVSILVLFIGSLYFLMLKFEILTDYLYISEFILTRLVLVLVLVILLQILVDLPITKGFQEELQIFNQDPKDKPFVALLR